MNSFHWKDFDAEKRKQFMNYLKHRNKKVSEEKANAWFSKFECFYLINPLTAIHF